MATENETVQVEVWVLIDEGGDYVAGTDPDALGGLYDDQVGGDRDAQSLRRIKVTLTVPLPKPIEMTGTVPAEPAGGALTAV